MANILSLSQRILLLGRSDDSAPVDSDANAYFAAIAAHGGTISDGSRTAVTSFVLGLKTDGLWDKLREIYPFAGNALNAAMVKLKYAAASSSPAVLVNHNFVAGDFVETGPGGGLQGDGVTKYLSTGYLDSSGTITDASLGIYQTVAATFGANMAAIGALGAGYCFIRATPFADHNNMEIGSLTTSVIAYGVGLIFATRTGATKKCFVNGALVDTNGSQSGTFAGLEMYVGAANAGGSAAIFSDATIAFAFIGTGLADSDAANLYNRIQALQTALGRGA